MPVIESTPEFVEESLEKMRERIMVVRKRLNRPLTFAEKLLYGHLDDPANAELVRGKSYLMLRPDRVCMQDATAQMAVLQFMQAGKTETAVPTTIHADHLIRALAGADEDLQNALNENNEVYKFLSSSAKKYGMGFWKPGAGIIHQVVLEQYAFPGQMVIGTDSHTPNGGGLGMWASGVGGADAVDVMAGFPWELLHPKVIGVKLTGELKGWAAPKDVILKLAGILTVKGGTNAVVEYFGEGTKSISCTGKSTICNMGAEIGATTSTFPYDERMDTYLQATERGDLIPVLERHRDLLTADPEVHEEPEKYFDQIIEIDLSELEPHLVGPHTPDLARPISAMRDAVTKEGYPDEISAALVGSCTNSSYEDIARVVDVVDQIQAAGLKMRTKLLITPGSETVRATIERDGFIEKLEAVGATVLANACGPCIGQWSRPELKQGTPNTIVSSFNRNFPKRNDGNAATLSFIGSPETVVAYGLAGRLSTDFLHETIQVNGTSIKLEPPGPAPEVPPGGFVGDEKGYQAPASPSERPALDINVDPESERIALLSPFEPWDGNDFERLPLLLKAKGKCTTDHISPAGPWLRFRGHLDNISNNMFNGVVNAFRDEVGNGLNLVTGEVDEYQKVARDYKARGLKWVAVGDENYGEGSSREHAAMEPRWLNAAAVLVRSFARIHETNLKKQGVLPLTFADPDDYDKVQETDRISIVGLDKLSPGKMVKVILHHEEGSTDEIETLHSLNADQIKWFRAGGALNTIRAQA